MCSRLVTLSLASHSLIGQSFISRSSVAQWSRPLNRPQCLLAWQADGSHQPGFKPRSGNGVFQLDWTSGHTMRLNSRTGIESPPVSSLNCDRPLHSGLKVPELVMDAGCRDNRWSASLCTWPPGFSPLVLPPSQEMGSARASLSLVGCRYTSKRSVLEKPTVLAGQRTQGLSNNAHTYHCYNAVGLHRGASLSADCGYNPGWCRSHPTVSAMT